MKILKLFLKLTALLLIVLNAYIFISGKTYVYKAFIIGYMRGHNSATIEDIQFFDTRHIEASEAQPWPVAGDYNTQDISVAMRQRLEANKSIAFTVIQNDSLRYEEYWDIGAKDSRTNSFSMAKTVVSILTGIAIDEGYLSSVNQKVIDIIPEYNRPGNHYNKEVSIKHLLTMSSGLNWKEDYYNPFGITAEAYFTKSLEPLMYSLDFVEKPGSKFHYQSGSTQLLGVIIERVTGMSLSEYASEKLWKPMGATDHAEWMLDDKNGTEKAYCCINSNALDFARFGYLFMHKGNWHGKQLVDSSYVEASLQADLASHYGYSWWLYNSEYKYPVFCMRGINGQYVITIPALNLVAVRLGHKRELYLEKTTSDLDYYIKEIIKQYDN